MIVACGGPAVPVPTPEQSSGAGTPATVAAPTTAVGIGVTSPAFTGDVQGFAVETVRLGGRSLLVAVADTSDLRGRGLMGVRDLGDLDGMVFVFEAEVAAEFTMRNTVIPLDIAFFDDAGVVVDRLEMVPCRAEPCPLYASDSEFRYALEMPAGTMGQVSDRERLILG